MLPFVKKELMNQDFGEKLETVDFCPLFALFCPRNGFVLDIWILDKILQLSAEKFDFCFIAPELS